MKNSLGFPKQKSLFSSSSPFKPCTLSGIAILPLFGSDLAAANSVGNPDQDVLKPSVDCAIGSVVGVGLEFVLGNN